MKKYIRVTLPCPHCGQNIKFNKIRPKLISPPQKSYGYIFKCPYKNCRKLVSAKVTDRKIKLSKRIPKVERTFYDLLKIGEEHSCYAPTSASG